MADFRDLLPRKDRRLLDEIALDAGCSSEAMGVQMIREYIALVQSAPDALPKSPLHRLTAKAVR